MGMDYGMRCSGGDGEREHYTPNRIMCLHSRRIGDGITI